MVSREMQPVLLRTYSGVDPYGQQMAIAGEPTTIYVAFGIYSHNQQSSPMYQDVTHYCLSDMVLADNQTIEVNGQEYKVLFCNPMGRLKQAFLKAK